MYAFHPAVVASPAAIQFHDRCTARRNRLAARSTPKCSRGRVHAGRPAVRQSALLAAVKLRTGRHCGYGRGVTMIVVPAAREANGVEGME